MSDVKIHPVPADVAANAHINAEKYDEMYKRSIDDPEGFWGEAAEAISWYRKWDQVLDQSDSPFYRWFSGGQTNTCYNASCIHQKATGED